jgi:hypothetical protein
MYITNKASKFTQQKLTKLKAETCKPANALTDFNTNLTVADRAGKQKINKNAGNLTLLITFSSLTLIEHNN